MTGVLRNLMGAIYGEEQAWQSLEARMPRWLKNLLIVASLLIAAALITMALKIGLEAFAEGIFPDYRS